MGHEDWEVDFKGNLTTSPPSLVYPIPSNSCKSFSISTQKCACMIHVGISIHHVLGSKLPSYLGIVERLGGIVVRDNVIEWHVQS